MFHLFENQQVLPRTFLASRWEGPPAYYEENLKTDDIDKIRRKLIIDKLLEPDFWVNPEVVVEIAADEITKSPTHSAGLALRFPRLVKFRDDKDPDRATTVAEVKKLYEMQKI